MVECVILDRAIIHQRHLKCSLIAGVIGTWISIIMCNIWYLRASLVWVRCTSCAIPSLIIEHQTKTPFGTDPGGWNSEPNRQKGPPQQIQQIPHSELKNQGHTIFQTRYRGGSLPVNSTLSKHLPSKGPYIESKIKGAAIILTSVYTSVLWRPLLF